MNHDMPTGQEEGIPFVSPKDFTDNVQIDFERAKKLHVKTLIDYQRKPVHKKAIF
jgi:hypothetical protein